MTIFLCMYIKIQIVATLTILIFIYIKVQIVATMTNDQIPLHEHKGIDSGHRMTISLCMNIKVQIVPP